MWLRGPIRNGAVEINRLVNFGKGVKASFAEPWTNVWYVDGENGNDRNSGRGPYRAKKLISRAEATASDNDVVYLKAGDHTMAAKLTWDLNDARLIGLSPIPMQPHLDIKMKVTTPFNPMIEVSGKGNIFANMTFRHGSETAALSNTGYITDLTCVLISGRYNYFENVYFYTPLYAEQDVAQADGLGGYEGVKITGHNNYFRGCKFGTDGLIRDQRNSNLSILGGIGNTFEDCVFQMEAGDTDPLFVFSNSSARDQRLTQFLNCKFYAHNSYYGAAPAHAFAYQPGGATAGFYFDSRCQFINVTQISDTTSDDMVWKPVLGEDTTVKKVGIALRNQGV